mgnify:CR=1 FL=1
MRRKSQKKKNKDKDVVAKESDYQVVQRVSPTESHQSIGGAEGSHGRGVIAFRGTDLNMGGVSGQADECADKLLWDDDEEADFGQRG